MLFHGVTSGVGSALTVRVTSDAAEPNWRTCAASTRCALAWATAATLGYALFRFSAPSPRMPNVEVVTLLLGVWPVPRLKKLVMPRKALVPTLLVDELALAGAVTSSM